MLASAWDLFLLRLPELLIVNEDCAHTSIGYVCTAEKALQRLGAVRTISQVSSAALRRPVVAHLQTDVLVREVGNEMTEVFRELTNNMILNPPIRKLLAEHMITDLISDLHDQI